MKLHTKAVLAAAASALALALGACSTPAPSPAPAPSMTASQASTVMRTGTFAGLNQKKVAGTVTVNGSTITLSGYSSDEGPDLHIYLANGTDEAAVSAGKQISAVAFNQASQTFQLSGVDAAMYTNVVIHCDKAKAVFGAATLS